ncbi:ferrochelatase [Marinomonas agarivorans]|nr:ferrochelatase [Marinomonas agarivorans]
MQEKSPDYGVLLVNLGTPDKPEKSAVKRYLKEFLSDRRVVDLTPWLWQPILNLIILNLRPKKVAKLYQKVWLDEGSPLLVLGNRLVSKVSQAMNTDDQSSNIPVIHAMTYGNPSIVHAATLLRQKSVKKLLVIPMYPQFSATTTAAVYDKLFKGLGKCPSWPAITLLDDYAEHPLYIKALAESVQTQWEKQGGKRHLVFSYHGIPQRYADNGDPYPRRCQRTSELVAEYLRLKDDEWTHVYQSRFGREEWLKPYADVTLSELPSRGVTSINIISPAFAIDCLETLEEICFELKDEFMHAGGREYDYITALNDSSAHVDLYKALIEENTKNWTACK